MPDYRLRDVELYLSTTRESSLNTQETTGSNFEKIATTQGQYVLPQIGITSNAGRPGAGHEFATSRCVTYVEHPRLTVTDEINTSYGGRLALRALGGSVTATQQGVTAAYKHSCVMYNTASSGLQLPSSTFISKIGTDASFLYAGAVVNSFTMSQTAADRPTFSAELIATGKFVRPHGVTSLPSSISTLTCLDGNQTVISWTDTVGAQTLTGAGCGVRSSSVSIQNNLQLNDRCPGDSTVTITDSGSSLTETPAYVGRLRLGDRVATAQITMLQDSDVANWLTYATTDQLTDFTITYRGAVIASTHRYAVSYIFPKCHIINVETTEDNGYAAYTMTVEADWDSSTSTAARCEVTNVTTSAFV